MNINNKSLIYKDITAILNFIILKSIAKVNNIKLIIWLSIFWFN